MVTSEIILETKPAGLSKWVRLWAWGEVRKVAPFIQMCKQSLGENEGFCFRRDCLVYTHHMVAPFSLEGSLIVQAQSTRALQWPSGGYRQKGNPFLALLRPLCLRQVKPRNMSQGIKCSKTDYLLGGIWMQTENCDTSGLNNDIRLHKESSLLKSCFALFWISASSLTGNMMGRAVPGLVQCASRPTQQHPESEGSPSLWCLLQSEGPFPGSPPKQISSYQSPAPRKSHTQP